MKTRTLLPLFALPLLMSQPAADLIITNLTVSITTDPQTLATTGSINAVVRNTGSVATPTGFQLTAFEDRDRNGSFDPAIDNTVGTANVSAALGPNATTAVIVPIAGTLLYRGSPILVMADSRNVVIEGNETNNTGTTAQNSRFNTPAENAFFPVLRWTTDTFVEQPTARASLSSPTVGDVNGDGSPDVVFSSNSSSAAAFVRVVRGDTGEVIFTIADPALRVASLASITLADIDNDARPELISVDFSSRLIVFEHDGTLKWRSALNLPGDALPGTATGPIVADLDANGKPEIIVGNQVYSATGTRLWKGTGAVGMGTFGHVASAVADLDLDGRLEVVAGPTAYRADGTIFWNRLNNPVDLRDGTVAIANLDSDPNPEIILRPFGSFKIYALEHDGTIKWEINHPSQRGGQPCVGDVDGDGLPEIGIVDQTTYMLLNRDGSVRWTRPIFESTSGITPSVFFDLNNDGRAEIIYGDQQWLYIFKGTDGTILNQIPRLSSTAVEGAVVADIDGDGHADILIPGDAPGSPNGRAMRAFSARDRNWANTRPVWNQDGFTITNVRDDLTIPTVTTPNWLVPGFNNFRTNGLLPGSTIGPQSAPDVTISLLRKLDAGFPTHADLIARVGNGGALQIPVTRVEFRDGPGGPLLGAIDTSRALNPGEYEDVMVRWNNPRSGQVNIVATVDPANVIAEGDETNNQHAVQLIFGQGPYVTIDDLIPRGKESGADLKWTPIPGAVSYNIYRRSGSGAPVLARAALVTSTGAWSDQGLTNNTVWFYTVRWLNASGQESQAGTESSVTPIPRTQRGDTPPSILSAPLTRGRTQTAYRYAPNAADPDAGEVLRWSLGGAPSGMTINSSTGVIDWIPGAGQGGSYRLTLTVTDSRNRQAVQILTLFIETQIVNTPPSILSTPVTSGGVSRLYSYAARGGDPDAGDVLTWLLETAPNGMTVNPATGLLQWTPGTTGTFPVVLRVRDLAGASVTQTFSILVQNLNRGPQFTSSPRTSATAAATYSYTAAATDPDPGDRLTWALVTAPPGMTIEPATGLVLWTPTPSQVGSYPISLEVRDIVGATALQSFTLAVAPPTSLNPPPVFVSEPVLTGRVAFPYAYDVNAVDPEQTVVTYSLVTAPSGAVIDSGSGLISWTPSSAQLGPNAFTVQARDAQGSAELQTFTVEVVAVPPATFELISPSIGADLRRQVPVVATITDPNSGGPTISWRVLLVQPGSADRQVGSGNGPVTSATIATINPTVLANDNYTVRVEITKGTETLVRELPYTVSGSLKPGRLTATVTDLTFPLGGIPLTISRVYDTVDTRRGDFGAGWRLAYPGGVTDAATESPLRGMTPGAKVWVTTLEGQRVSFRFDPVAPAFLFPYVVTPRFTADAGNTGKLEVSETSVFLFEGVAYRDFTNVWNPSRYIYTSKEGVRYELDETAGIQSIRDRSGNTLTFSPSAITSSTGVQVTLERDGAGRITRIREPNGGQMVYAYDAAGNLTGATDQLNRTSRYFYENASLPNHLTRIEDPLGRATVRNVFGPDGALTASCPPEGNLATLLGCTRFSFDHAALGETRVDPRGFRRDYLYDDRGNLLTERRYLDTTAFRETVRTYDSSDRMLTERNPGGGVTAWTYDTAGNILSETDPGGRRRSFTYSAACNKRATETDPAGGVASYTYDAQCRLTFARDRAGRTTEYRYDAMGNTTHFIDPRGSITAFTHTPQGYVATIRDPRGNLTTFTWSSTGDLQQKVDRNGRRTTFDSDALHRTIRETWDNGRVITFGYDASGFPASAADGAFTSTLVFDALGRISSESSGYSSGATYSTTYTYDAAGNRVTASDSLGGGEVYSYDGLGQLISIAQSGAGLSPKRVQFDYDLAGLRSRVLRFASTSSSNPVANTAVEYDCTGCATRLSALRHTNPSGSTGLHIMTFSRNALGDVSDATDNQGLHLYEYDGAQRLTRATHPNPLAQPNETYSYDAAGNRLTSHLSATHSYPASGDLLQSDDQSEYTYDAEGNLTQRRNRADGSVIQYQYDHRNRVTLIIARNGSGVETGRTAFAFDALDRRMTATDSAGETRFLYGGLNPAGVVAPGNVLTRRLYGPGIDQVLAEDTPAGTRWLLTDAVGTVRTILDSTGAVAANLLTDSFGRALSNSNPGVSSQLAFTGRETIPVSGDLYFRARLYDPRTGRFLQTDPIEPFGYAYGDGSPLVKTDPFGLAAAVQYGGFTAQTVERIHGQLCILYDQAGQVILRAAMAAALQFGQVGTASSIAGAGLGIKVTCLP